MAPIRITSLQRRRRSSLALNPFTPAKAGIYGIARPVTFAPNVTPGTFVDPEESTDLSSPDSPTTMTALFPPSDTASTATRKRCPPGKRRSQGYIPRPPNAFMLFRADFVRQKHVPGSIETNHGSLSKIIGNCWRALPLEEKRVWEIKAKHAKAEHKARYPDYRFRPVHNKNKDKKKEKQQPTVEDERRCEEVAQLLLEGKKGDELAAAIRDLDRFRSQTPVEVVYPPRRPSSVPLPNEYIPYFNHIALPSLPHFSSRPSSPPIPLSHQQRKIFGARRPSSAGPAIMTRSWMTPMPQQMFHQDNTPLPEADMSLFNSSWSSSFPTADPHSLFGYAHTMPGLLDLQSPASHPQNPLGPLDTALPVHIMPQAVMDPAAAAAPQFDMSWMQMGFDSHIDTISKDSSVYSGSPEPTEEILHAPLPQQMSEAPISNILMYHPESLMESQPSYDVIAANHDLGGLDYNNSTASELCAPNDSMIFQGFPAGLDPMFDGQSYNHHHHHHNNALYDLNAIVAHE